MELYIIFNVNILFYENYSNIPLGTTGLLLFIILVSIHSFNNFLANTNTLVNKISIAHRYDNKPLEIHSQFIFIEIDEKYSTYSMSMNIKLVAY